MTPGRGDYRELAMERIEILISLAKKASKGDERLAKRYLSLAKKIGMRCNVRLPREEKTFICKRCGSLLVPGVNCRVRLRPEGGGRLALTCLICGFIRRYPFRRKR